jgi:hypothetical protein
MKRLLVFFLVGPLILGAAISVLFGAPSGLGSAVGLPVAGFAAAFPTAAIDYALKGQRWQLVSVAACGCLVPIVLFHSPLAGVAGGISAAFCSWLTNQSWQPEHLG